MDEYTKLMKIIENWLDIIATDAIEDFNDDTMQSYDEFSERTVSQLEDVLMEYLYNYYSAVYNDPDSVL